MWIGGSWNETKKRSTPNSAAGCIHVAGWRGSGMGTCMRLMDGYWKIDGVRCLATCLAAGTQDIDIDLEEWTFDVCHGRIPMFADLVPILLCLLCATEFYFR